MFVFNKSEAVTKLITDCPENWKPCNFYQAWIYILFLLVLSWTSLFFKINYTPLLSPNPLLLNFNFSRLNTLCCLLHAVYLMTSCPWPTWTSLLSDVLAWLTTAYLNTAYCLNLWHHKILGMRPNLDFGDLQDRNHIHVEIKNKVVFFPV